MELGRCTNSDNVTIYLYIVKCRWNRRKCSYKGFLMKWYQLSVEEVSNQMSDTHSPQQVVQHNDAKCNNSLGIRTRIVSIPDFYSHFQAQISWTSHGCFPLSMLCANFASQVRHHTFWRIWVPELTPMRGLKTSSFW